MKEELPKIAATFTVVASRERLQKLLEIAEAEEELVLIQQPVWPPPKPEPFITGINGGIRDPHLHSGSWPS